MRRNAFVSAVMGAAALAGAFSSDARADRNPTAQEWAEVVTALRDAGYTTWSEIEFDDGQWEVDEARAADGKRYELKLDRSYKIVKREPEGS